MIQLQKVFINMSTGDDMKRTGIVILALMLASFALSGCMAKEQYVKIDQKNFPDVHLYNTVLSFDSDQDSKLSRSEIENATSITLGWVKDFTGLDLFTNLETIYIRECENIKCDYKLFTNLKTLSINGTCESKLIDLSGNTKLEIFYIDSENLEELVLPKGAPLKDIMIENTLLKSIDLNSYKGLTRIELNGNELIEELSFRDFPELTKLTCSTNTKLNSLNVSNCPKLNFLECNSNDLTDLNISGCENIAEFSCWKNKSLTSLDLSAFPKLTYLNCCDNEIAELEIIHCPELTTLYCVRNRLKSLDLKSTPKLTTLTCGGNPFKELDVSCIPDLESLSCYDCELTSLNITGCSKLHQIICQDNKLTSLDLTGCPELHGLYCTGNNLTSLDFSRCPGMVELINTTTPTESKDGKSFFYYDGGAHGLDVDKEVELVKSN